MQKYRSCFQNRPVRCPLDSELFLLSSVVTLNRDLYVLTILVLVLLFFF